ncbi:MAG: hypothetical protein JJ964_14140, partial [Rhizobiales bacterium]|nr:hypothetical protein [Hyphomicrobiales bacterium]
MKHFLRTRFSYQSTSRKSLLLSLVALSSLGVASSMTPAVADGHKELKIGFVTFLSGGAAGPFGVPARNAAELM